MKRTKLGADVVVIGAGIVGASAARELAHAGLEVAILDRGAVNREGSGTTAGNFHIQCLAPERHGRPRESARFVPLQRAAADVWATLEDELSARFEYRRSGGVVVAETDAEVEILRAKHRLEAAGGIESYLLDASGVRAELPMLSEAVIAADVCPEDGYVNPVKVVHALLDDAVRRGAKVTTYAQVSSIQPSGRGFRVHTSDRSWSTAAVVNATGPWLHRIAAMAGIEFDLVPSAIQMCATVRTPPQLDRLIQHVGKGLSVKQVASGNVLIGGGWPAAALDLEGRSPVSVPSLLANLDLAVRIVPLLRSLRVLRAWAGPYSVTRDELPVIGEVAALPGFYIAGGPHAFTLGPLWGRVVRDLVLQRRLQVDIAGLEPERLIGRRGP